MWVPQTDNYIDFSTMIDHLNNYKDHPLNINFASREQLQEFGLLNEVQITSLLNHIRQFGKLIEVYELQSIDGFNYETIERILPFIVVQASDNTVPLSFKNFFTKGKQELDFLATKTLEPSVGYAQPITQSELLASKKYLGSPYLILMKYKYTFSDQLSFGFTGKKDAGAEFFQGSNAIPKHTLQFYKGFDYYSAHLLYKGKGFIKTLAIGDYQLGFGQGLCLSSGLSFSKTGDVLGIKKMSRDLIANTSSNANAFMRGYAATFAYKHFEFTPFYSYHKLDGIATSVDSLTQDPSVFSSLGTSGYHRTYKELSQKQIIGEAMYGGHLAYNIDKLNIGITSYHTQFDADYIRKPKYYNQFDFSGRSNNNIGLDYSYIIKNYNFFGEVARSANAGMAYLSGVLLSVDSRTSIAILYRNYAKDYQALQSNGFKDGTSTSNEEGTYIGLTSNLTKFLVFSAYYDQFYFPWLHYECTAPSHGTEYLVQLAYTPNKKLAMNIRFKESNKQTLQGNMIIPIYYLIGFMQNSLQFNLQYKFSNALSVAEKVVITQSQIGHYPQGNGYLLSQDVILKIQKSKLSIVFRYALFDCNNYYSRVFVSGGDIPNSFSIPSLNNQGSLTNLMIQYHLIKGVSIWLRMAQTVYTNVATISSGLDLINGNTKTDVSAEVRISF